MKIFHGLTTDTISDSDNLCDKWSRKYGYEVLPAAHCVSQRQVETATNLPQAHFVTDENGIKAVRLYEVCFWNWYEALSVHVASNNLVHSSELSQDIVQNTDNLVQFCRPYASKRGILGLCCAIPLSLATVLGKIGAVWLICLLPLLFLLGCTGSQEVPPSTLLLLGHAEDKLALLASASLFNKEASTPLAFLANRSVAGESLALDIVDRSNRRKQAVLLVAKGTAYALEFFDLTGIDPSDFQDDSMFRPSRTALSLELAKLEQAPTVTTKPLALCPSSLQVSRNGQYVALINDQRRCSQLSSTGLLVLDVQVNPVRLVYHHETGVFPQAFYLDQTSERLYYFSEQAGGARLEQLDLSNLSNSEILTLNNNDRPPALRALRRYNNDLLVLRDSNYTIIKNIFSNEVSRQGDTISTSSGSQTFVVDDFLAGGQVYISGTRGLTVHKDASDTEEKLYNIGGSLASYDFANSLIYAPRTGNIGVFDTFSQQLSSTISFSQVQNPKVSTVIQGVIRNTQR